MPWSWQLDLAMLRHGRIIWHIIFPCVSVISIAIVPIVPVPCLARKLLKVFQKFPNEFIFQFIGFFLIGGVPSFSKYLIHLSILLHVSDTNHCNCPISSRFFKIKQYKSHDVSGVAIPEVGVSGDFDAVGAVGAVGTVGVGVGESQFLDLVLLE